MTLDVSGLKAALERWADGIERVAPELNERDGQLGDGDLGATLAKCASNVRAALPGIEGDLGTAFRQCALATSRASGSSFGTLLTVAFMVAAKKTEGRASIEWTEVPDLLAAALAAMSQRGGASLGDKTVLDTLDAACRAGADIGEPRAQHDAMAAAVARTIEAFRGRPNRIGRARMFAERSIGIDDPGMIAFQHMLMSLRGD
jgi:dihydroxyacetone kinase-like protein